MPWNIVTAMDSRREFVALASVEGANISELCRRFGISRKTGYKWMERWRESSRGEEFAELSRKPHKSPARTRFETEAKVLAVRRKHPVWGGRKLRAFLLRQGVSGVPSASTITAILRRHGLLGQAGAGGGGGPVKRFERASPNELWQMDYKGDFGLSGGGRCHALTALDDHSRFNIVLAACGNQQRTTVQGHLEVAFERYGLPDRILCDNGSSWGQKLGGMTKLGVWLLRVGVDVIHGRPYHPQTQGKEERFHRTLKAEVISRRKAWRDLGECQREFDRWRGIYNLERPHESLDDGVPVERYEVSHRPYPGGPVDPASHYVQGDVIRRVKSKGEITFGNVFYYIGNGFVGHEVGLRACGEGRWDVYFAWKKLGSIDLRALEGKEKGRYERLQK